MLNRQLELLAGCGQSIWYDNLSRDVLQSGELASLIEAGVVGLTSNPTIFKKAIADSNDYDGRISELVADNDSDTDVDSLCENLMVEDVRAAADLLMPIYEESKGNDGFASIEVSPAICHDAQATIEAARRISDKISRPNIMIKIPATEAGLDAITETLASGIHVNVTLIFSLKMYKRVVESYLAGLEKRLETGGDIRTLRSVASFFVSRVDVSCNQALLECSNELQQALMDKVGIANSKLAYAHYLKTLESDRFEQLKKEGAALQRPLWASTGTKNPDLPLTYYVEALAGQDTVNTLPPATLHAVMEASKLTPALSSDCSDADKIMSLLSQTKVPFETLLEGLLKDGLSSFEESYNDLLLALRNKLKES